MAIIKTVRNCTPKFGDQCWISETAVIVGDVACGSECSFWFNSVVRGDVNAIRFGNKVNVQDGAVVHCTYNKASTTIGNNVSIGHNAIVHGCTIDDNVLVGMGSIVMDNCHVGSGSIIGAGSVVLEGTIIPPGSLYAGVPAKLVKKVDEDLLKKEVNRIADNYVMYSSWFKD